MTLRVAVDELRLPAFTEAAALFTGETGVEVEFTVAAFHDIAGMVDDVDIIVGTHVDLWRLADAERILPLDLSGLRDGFEPLALHSLIHDGSVVGLPYAADVVALLWNPSLIDGPPTDMVDLADACVGIEVSCLAMGGGTDVSLLHNSPFLNVGDGAVFIDDGTGAWDPSAIGLLAAGGSGVAVLEDLVETGLVAPVTVGEARDAFVEGQAAMYVTGPWDLGLLSDAGVDFAVGAFPQVGGAPAHPMVGVQAVAVSGSSEHAVIAMEFVRGYLSTLEVQRELHEADPRVAVLIELSNELTDQRDVGFTMAFRQGSPIPPLAEMDQAWMIVGDALARVRQGLVTGVEALERADELLQEAVGSS